MVDMNTLERQLADESLRIVGPAGPVDDAAIFTAITTTPSPKWRFQSMFSATKFLVAGVIVALFGGFLLAGILAQPSDDMAPAAVTASPSPVTTEDLLSGMVTDEVEPGVYRVLEDGAGHDLVAEPPVGVTVGADDSVWLLRASQSGARGPHSTTDAIFELGREGTFPLEASGVETSTFFEDTDLAVDSEGTAWVAIGTEGKTGGNTTLIWGRHGTLAAFDGTAWTTPTWPDGSGNVGAIEATADGTVWVARSSMARPSVAKIEDGAWSMSSELGDQSLGGPFRGQPGWFAASADGTAWLANGKGNFSDTSTYAGLLRFDGESWDAVELPGESEDLTIAPWGLDAGPIALGPDGTLWVFLQNQPPDESQTTNLLARLDTDGWTVFTEEDGVPLLDGWVFYEAHMATDAEGRLWIAVAGEDGGNGSGGGNGALPPPLGSSNRPVGVLAFDGITWSQYLAGLHVNRVDVAADGSVFATAVGACLGDPCEGTEDRDPSQAGLYVITPEAVAASE